MSTRFVSSRIDDESFRNLVLDSMVEHFSLFLSGAPVEPLYANEIDPECHIHYLEGVRYFTEGTREAHLRSARALRRALLADAAFLPASAMLALVELQLAVGNEIDTSAALSAARHTAEACQRDAGGRLSAAFLDAAIAIGSDHEEGVAERMLREACSRCRRRLRCAVDCTNDVRSAEAMSPSVCRPCRGFPPREDDRSRRASKVWTNRHVPLKLWLRT